MGGIQALNTAGVSIHPPNHHRTPLTRMTGAKHFPLTRHTTKDLIKFRKFYQITQNKYLRDS
jgi:hypothetical protein